MVTSIESIFGISIHFEDRFRIISPPLPGLFTPLKWGFISTYATYNYLSKNHVGCLSRHLHFYVHFIVKLPVQPQNGAGAETGGVKGTALLGSCTGFGERTALALPLRRRMTASVKV